MLQDDVKLLQAVRDWRPPDQLHPIAMYAWHLYEKNRDALPAPAIEELRAILDGYGDDLKGLAEGIEGLTRFLLLMTEHLHDQATATKVADLLRSYTSRFEPFWERVGEALTNVVAHEKGHFASFTDHDRSAEKVAPLAGQPPPKGTVPLRSLAPPPRPPRWTKKVAGHRPLSAEQVRLRASHGDPNPSGSK
jgi:hypothetical protein